ncbi:MAG: hypothetical protein IPN20_23250 [Haliscomenobacter sp.]|nr:hypothetical protein [Haliscomenobacter sp.]
MIDNIKAFRKLKKIGNNLDKVDYNEVKSIIKDSIQKIPICTAKVNKGHFIDRARINKGNDLFDCESQVSYIKDKKVIDEYLTEFGRANKPHEVMFYGSVISTLIEQPRMTALWETSELLADKNSVNVKGQLFTISRFDITENFEVLELVFSRQAIKNNPDIKRSFEFQMKNVEAAFPELVEYSKELLIFFSEQFSRKKKTHHDYKISCAYSELVLDNYKTPSGEYLAGISFPSVQSGLIGHNLALKPVSVDKYLKLSGVWTVKIHKNRKKAIVNNHKFVSSFGANNCNFQWEDTNPINVRPYPEIEKELTNKGCLGFWI